MTAHAGTMGRRHRRQQGLLNGVFGRVLVILLGMTVAAPPA